MRRAAKDGGRGPCSTTWRQQAGWAVVADLVTMFSEVTMSITTV